MLLKNNLKVAFRYLYNHKSYSAINIIGLTLGFLCFLILNAYVSSEKNFDTQHGNVYRVLEKEKSDDGSIQEIATVGPQIGYASKEQFPEIETVTELVQLGRFTVGNNPASRNYEHVTTIDQHFFDVFNFNFVEGSAANLFAQANGVLLTESLKKKYFGNEEALGKALKTNVFDAIVGGVIEDFPSDTHVEAGFIVPEQTAATVFNWWNDFVSSNWHRNAFLTYFKLREDADIASLERKITRLASENWPEEEAFNSTFALQSIRDIHLYAHEVDGEMNKSKGNLFYINIFFWIALMILLVACFNYTGLLNVAFMGRSKEIGVRKVVGAGQGQLLWQFLMESLLLTSLSLVIAILALQFVQPLLPQLFGAAFDLSTIPHQKILWIAAIGLGISLLSIAYPAFVISKLAVVNALKEDQQGQRKVPFRKVMTVFQFVAAIVLIACTSILYRQVNYLQQKELGFDMNGLVVVDINSGALRSKYESIKHEFAKLPEVQSVSVSSRVPGEWKQFPLADVTKSGQNKSQSSEMIFIGADADFLSTYKIDVLQGTNFTHQIADSNKVLVNQSAIEHWGMEEPIGQWIDIAQVNWSGDIETMEQPLKLQIAGVVEDFHFEDFRRSIQPMLIGYWNNPIQRIDYYSLRVSTSDWGNTIAALRRINDSFDADNPLEFHILNDQFARFYEADIWRSRLLLFFAGVVIFIACLGLLAMTAFTLKNRTKEIGIRKVLGASAQQIVGLIASDFLKLVLLGAVIAIPLAWLLMSRWLNEFAYRIPLHWWLFACAGLITIGLALLTISLQSIRTALTKPVDSLRSE